LQFELSVFLANLPRHWSLETEKQKPVHFDAKAWLLGQLVSAEAALELLAYRANAERAPWPEFAEYNCFSCHHDLSQPSWRQRRAHYTSRPPGSIPWGTWYFSVPSVLGNAEVASSLESLRPLMEKGNPARQSVAEQAAKAARLAHAWRGQVSTSPDSELARKLLLGANARAQKLAEENWDCAEQLYLALSALAAGQERLQPALEALGRTLAYPTLPGGPRFDSPKGFAPDKEKLFVGFGEILAQLAK
jgi:hypothetical protein